MPDQYGVVTRLLGVMGLAHKWYVVEPVSDDLQNRVWIQNATEKLDGYVRLSPAASDNLSEDEIIELILNCTSSVLDRDSHPVIRQIVSSWVEPSASGSGAMMGQYLDAAGTGRSFLLDNGVFTTIDVTGAFPNSVVYEINDRGQIAGVVYSTSAAD